MLELGLSSVIALFCRLQAVVLGPEVPVSNHWPNSVALNWVSQGTSLLRSLLPGIYSLGKLFRQFKPQDNHSLGAWGAVNYWVQPRHCVAVPACWEIMKSPAEVPALAMVAWVPFCFLLLPSFQICVSPAVLLTGICKQNCSPRNPSPHTRILRKNHAGIQNLENIVSLHRKCICLKVMFTEG